MSAVPGERPLFHPIRVLRSRLRWPPVARERLLRATSFGELRAIAGERPLEGFNGQIVRLKFLIHLSEVLACSSFVETGSFLGWTATAAVHFLRLPVFSVERRSVVTFARLRARLLGVRSIEFRRGDSRTVLEGWLRDPRLGLIPMLYLDAHWGGDAPVRDEVHLAVARGRCAVVIDDCEVPDRPEFGHDQQRGVGLGIRTIADLLPRSRASILVPAHAAALETGARRGTVIVLIDIADPRARMPAFAGSLFTPISLADLTSEHH